MMREVNAHPTTYEESLSQRMIRAVMITAVIVLFGGAVFYAGVLYQQKLEVSAE